MKVSVVINTYNRASNLIDALESLKFQSYLNFEVIVVNGPSSDDTKAIVLESEARYYEISEVNLSISRNVGLREARGEVVAFMDDDAQPDNDWLANIVREFKKDECIGAVGGPLLDHTGMDYQCYFNLANRYAKAREVFFDPSEAFSFPQAAEFPTLTGCNCSFRMSVLKELGGFDEQFAYFLEETDLCLRVIDAGYKIQFAADIIVHHKYAPSHLRVEGRLIKNYYPSLRSIAYFSQKHTLPFYGEDACANHLSNVQREHADSVLWNYRHGKYSKVEYDEIVAHSKLAFDDGQADLKPKHWNGHTSSDRFSTYKKVAVASRRLRVVFVTREYPPGQVGGIARLTEELAKGLSTLGHTIHVITRAHNGVSCVDFESGHWVHRIADDNDIYEFEENANIPRNILERATAVRREIDRLAKMFEIQVISAPIWDVEGLLLLEKYTKQLVTTLHTSYKLSIDNHPKWVEDRHYFTNHVSRIIAAEKRMLVESRYLLGNSQAIVSSMNDAYALKIDGARCHVIPHGVVAPSLDFDHTIFTSKEEINILFLGRLEHRKGIDLLIESAELLLLKHTHVRLSICGDDRIKIEGKDYTYRQYYDQKYQNERWYERIDYLGYLPWCDVTRLLSNCDVFVAPSRFESFGLIHAEALSYGKPVVGLNAAATPEVVTADVGLLATPEDVQHLFECLDSLVLDAKKRRDMGSAAKLRYEENYRISSMVERTELFYYDVQKMAK